MHNPELIDVFVKVQEGEVKLKEESIEVSRLMQMDQERKSNRGVAAYDNTLLALSDTEDMACKLANDPEKRQQHLVLNCYLSF